MSISDNRHPVIKIVTPDTLDTQHVSRDSRDMAWFSTGFPEGPGSSQLGVIRHPETVYRRSPGRAVFGPITRSS